MVIELPWPPSINHYWRHTKNGHYISREGISYREMVYYSCINYQGIFDASKRISVIIEAFPPDKRKRDLDNLLKSTLDSLQHAKVYADDSQIDYLAIKRNSEFSNKIIVEIL
jgi:crossover junction endodeoxyribonuclease RusA